MSNLPDKKMQGAAFSRIDAWAGPNGDNIVNWYGHNILPLRELCTEIGCSYDTMVDYLSQRGDVSRRAREARADALHDRAIAQLSAEPTYIIEIKGENEVKRIDSASVQLIKMRLDGAAKLSGILSKRYQDQSKQEVTVTLSPLASFLQSIQESGNNLPLGQGRTIEHDQEDTDTI